MIPLEKRLFELTYGDVIQDMEERFRHLLHAHPNKDKSSQSVFITMKECSALTGYTMGYLRQMVFKRSIPFHKNPKLRPVRFKRDEILEWMANTKFTPIDELANNYLSK
jgi:excisionase family DNA binding protein